MTWSLAYVSIDMPSDGWYKSGHLRIENTTHCYLVCQRLTPLVTSRWGLVCRRAICSKQARCRAVSCTRGKTVGAGAMAVGIRHACREHWALFRSYDTIPPSVRILLPSTTSDGQGRDRACLPPRYRARGGAQGCAREALCPIDFIGNSVYSVYAKLQYTERETARFFGSNRLNAGRVSAVVAGVSGCLRPPVSVHAHACRQTTAAPHRWRSQRGLTAL